MLIIEFIAVFFMFIGLLCTLAPRLHGTIMILSAGIGYIIIIGIAKIQPWIFVSLLLLALFAELGVRWLRIYITKGLKVSKTYSIDSTICNLAGIIVISTLLRSIIGMTIWQAIVGKSILPRLDSIGKVLIRLFFTALLRFVCGLIMIIIILKYVMI